MLTIPEQLEVIELLTKVRGDIDSLLRSIISKNEDFIGKVESKEDYPICSRIPLSAELIEAVAYDIMSGRSTEIMSKIHDVCESFNK